MKYIAKPIVVDAWEITDVAKEAKHLVRNETGSDWVGGETKLLFADREEFICDEGMTARMDPKPGDYLVMQSDGYVYLNPKDVFEGKYGLKKNANQDE